MQGDIFQLASMTDRQTRMFESTQEVNPIPTTQDKRAKPLTAIYNEDDLSDLLFDDEADRIIINDVDHYHHCLLMPWEMPLMEDLESHTPPTATSSHTPVLSDCDSELGLDDDYGFPSFPFRQNDLRHVLEFEDGFDFSIFLGRQAEEPCTAPAESLSRMETSQSTTVSSHMDSPKTRKYEKDENFHVDDISGPMMSWWPAPLDVTEHDWTDSDAQQKKQDEAERMIPARDHVEHIEDPLMTWWPEPPAMLNFQWNENFYE